MFCVISALPFAASVTLRRDPLVVAVCSSTALAMVFEMSAIWLMMSPIWRDGVDSAFVIRLDGFDLPADVLGGGGGLLGQFLHFVGDHREAFAGFTARAPLRWWRSEPRGWFAAIEVMTFDNLADLRRASPSFADRWCYAVGDAPPSPPSRPAMRSSQSHESMRRLRCWSPPSVSVAAHLFDAADTIASSRQAVSSAVAVIHLLVSPQ